MLNVESYSQKAKNQFSELLRKRVAWISESCWPCNLSHNLKEINELISAAVVMNVSGVCPFSEEMIAELVTDLSPLRTLEMSTEVKELLV